MWIYDITKKVTPAIQILSIILLNVLAFIEILYYRQWFSFIKFISLFIDVLMICALSINFYEKITKFKVIDPKINTLKIVENK